MITVKIGKTMGRISEYALEEGTSLRKALEVAGIEVTEGYEVRVNNEAVEDLDREASNGDLILLVKKIKGNK